MLPVITISRQYGSGGHEVGEKVAQKLNLPFYDKALIAMAAKKSGLSEEVFADADEKATSSLLYSMVMGSYAFGARVPGINEMPINDKLFIIQSDIIKKAAAEGPCVIVGRCADYILREKKNLLTVVLHAPMEYRVKRVMTDQSITNPTLAEKTIKKQDKARADYYNFFTHKKWGDAGSAMLSVDTSMLDTDGIAALIADAVTMVERNK